MLPVRETLEHTYGVIADGCYAETLLPDRVQMLFQLDELDLAERSPIRGPEEHEHGPFRTHDRFESLVPALLVGRRKSRHLLTHLRSGFDALAVQCCYRERPDHQFDERSLCHANRSLLRT
jgi:hypothetical protein